MITDLEIEFAKLYELIVIANDRAVWKAASIFRTLDRVKAEIDKLKKERRE
jgi:hypothetical protein